MPILRLKDENGNWISVPSIAGPKGDIGPEGPQGGTGPQGDPGPMPVFTIGTVEALEPGAEPYVRQRGTAAEPILDFGIPGADAGVVLFSGSPVDSFTLSESADDFEYLEFHCGKGESSQMCLKVPKELYNSASLHIVHRQGVLSQIIMKTVQIVDKQVNVLNYSVINMEGGIIQTYDSNELTIHKVVGYK